MVEGHISEWCVLWYLCFMTISIFLKIGRVCFQKLLYMALEIIVSCKTAKLLFGPDLCLLTCGLYITIFISVMVGFYVWVTNLCILPVALFSIVPIFIPEEYQFSIVG